MIRINLIGERRTSAADVRRSAIKLLGCIAALLCLGCGVRFLLSSDCEILRERRLSGRQKITALNDITNRVLALEEEVRQHENRLVVVRAIKDAKATPMGLINAVIDVLPPKALLTDIQQARQDVRMVGLAQDGEAVSLLVRQLNSNPLFEGVTLDSVRQGVFRGVKLQEFVVRCRIAGGTVTQSVIRNSQLKNQSADF